MTNDDDGDNDGGCDDDDDDDDVIWELYICEKDSYFCTCVLQFRMITKLMGKGLCINRNSMIVYYNDEDLCAYVYSLS